MSETSVETQETSSVNERLPSEGPDESRQLRSAFLSGLPSFKRDNFARFSQGGAGVSLEGGANSTGYRPSSSRGRPSVYVCTKDYHGEQLITTEKTNILLRYLHKQWDRKNIHVKRGPDAGQEEDDFDEEESTSPTACKVAKVEMTTP